MTTQKKRALWSQRGIKLPLFFVHIRLYFIAFLFGAPALLSFAPYNYWGITFVSLSGLLFILYNKTPKISFKIGFWWGVGFFSFGIQWVYNSISVFGGMPLWGNLFLISLLVIYLALFPALFGLIFNISSLLTDKIRYLVWGPTIWLLIEWFRGTLFTGFSWLELGYSQLYSPLRNLAPIFAVDSITLSIALISSLIVLTIKLKKLHYLIIPFSIFLMSHLLGEINWVKPSLKKEPKVAIIQGNVNQLTKFLPEFIIPTIDNYLEDSSHYWDADLIVWPETAIPSDEASVASYLNLINNTAREHETAILSGIINFKKPNIYNSVIVLGSGQPYNYQVSGNQLYNKYHLLPFGEFVPLGSVLRKLIPFFNLDYSDFTPGLALQKNLYANGYNIAPAICFEILFNEEVRRNITPETDILLTVSNDSWFGDSNGPRQHLQIAQMRSLEFGKPLIRSTNSGISALVDSNGSIIQEFGLFKKGSFMNKLPLTEGTTPYYQWGKKPLLLFMLLNLISALIIILLKKKRL